MARTRKTPQTYECRFCGKENKWKYSSYNLYCDNACQREYEWVHNTKPRIAAGGGSKTHSKTIRRFLIEEQGAYCEECRTGNTWNGKPLTLHVDHIDGDSDNCQVENLRLLCPNCHSQTSTWGSRGKGNRYKKQTSRACYNREYRRKQ